MLSVRLLVNCGFNSESKVIRGLGVSKVICGFFTVQRVVVLNPSVVQGSTILQRNFKKEEKQNYCQ